jgi:hypothetical protein
MYQENQQMILVVQHLNQQMTLVYLQLLNLLLHNQLLKVRNQLQLHLRLLNLLLHNQLLKVRNQLQLHLRLLNQMHLYLENLIQNQESQVQKYALVNQSLDKSLDKNLI